MATFSVGGESVPVDIDLANFVGICKKTEQRRPADEMDLPRDADDFHVDSTAGSGSGSGNGVANSAESDAAGGADGGAENSSGLFGSAMGGFSSVGGGMGASFTALSVLDAGTKMRMNPLQMRKAGVIIKNMQGAGYSDEQINDVCRALVCSPAFSCARQVKSYPEAG